MASPIKRIPKEKVTILHACSEEDRIKRVELILVGNGNPKDGYVYKVMEIGEKIKDIDQKLTGISGTVKELYDKSIGESAITNTDEQRRAEKRLIWQKWIQTLAFIVAATGLTITAFFSFRGDKKQDVIITKQDQQGVPVVVNSRGEMLFLPDSTRILWIYNDSAKFMVKKVK